LVALDNAVPPIFLGLTLEYVPLLYTLLWREKSA
jgi:hypothetical protein